MATVGALLIRIMADSDSLKRELERSGKLTGNLQSDMQRMGKIGAAAVSALGAAAIATTAAVVSLTKSVAEHGESLQKMATRTGVSAGILSELGFSAHLADIDMEQLGRGVKQLSSGMLDAMNGTGEAASALAAMGVAVRGNQGELRNSIAVLMDIADAFAGMKNETERSAYASKLFGRASQELIPWLSQGSAAIRETMLESRALGNTWDSVNTRAAAELSDNYKRLVFAGNALLETAMRPMIPVLNRIVNEMLTWIKANQDWLQTRIIEGMVSFGRGLNETWIVLKGISRVMYEIASSPFASFLAKVVLGAYELARIVVDILIGGFVELGIAVGKTLSLLTFGKANEQIRSVTDSLVQMQGRVRGMWAQHTRDLQETMGVLQSKTVQAHEAGIAAAGKHGEALDGLNKSVLQLAESQQVLGQQIVAGAKAAMAWEKELADQQQAIGKRKVEETQFQLRTQELANRNYFESLKTMEEKAAFISHKQWLSGMSANPRMTRGMLGGPIGQQYNVPGIDVAKFQEEAGASIVEGTQEQLDEAIRLYDELEGKALGTADELMPKDVLDRAEGNLQQTLGQMVVDVGKTEDVWTRSMQQFSDSATFAFGAIRTSFGSTLAGLMMGTATWADFYKATMNTVLNTAIQSFLTMTVEWVKQQYAQIAAAEAIEQLKAAVKVKGDAMQVASNTAKDSAIVTGDAAAGAATLTIWKSVGAGIVGTFAAITGAIVTFWTGTVVPAFVTMGAAITGFLSAMATALDVSIFGAAFSVPIWAAVGLVAAAVGALVAFSVGAFAEGGIVSGPTLAMIGEGRSKEAVIPLDGNGARFMREAFGGVGGNGGPTTIIVELDGEPILKHVKKSLPTIMRLKGLPA